MKRVKGVEDLNICNIGAQGIVGVGATIRTYIAWSQVAACPMMVATGIPPAATSWSRRNRSQSLFGLKCELIWHNADPI